MEIQTEFRRDLHHNYMLLSGGKDLDRLSYEVRMLEVNEIPGLLRCHLQEIDRILFCCYDITSRQSLDLFLETHTVDRRLLHVFFTSMQKTLLQMEDYLLPLQGICLNPEKIFLDASGQEMRFCFYPGEEEDFSGQLKNFAEYLLPRLSHEDPGGVVLGYAFYQRVTANENTAAGVLIREMLQAIAQTEVSDKEDAGSEEKFSGERETPETENREEQNQNAGILQSFFPVEENGKENIRKSTIRNLMPVISVLLYGILPAALAFLTGIIAFYRLKSLQKGIGVGSCTAALVCIFLYRWRKFRERQKSGLPQQPDFFSGNSGNPPAGNRNDIPEKKEEKSAPLVSGTEWPEVENEKLWQNEDPLFHEQEETVFLGSLSVPDREPAIRARLIPQPAGAGKTFALVGERYLLGKSSEAADLCVPSPAVSRLHARLLWDGTTYRVLDMNSRNGTFINDVLLEAGEATPITDGDRLRLADRVFRYEEAKP